MSKVVRLFGPQQRARYAREKKTTPSGVIFEWNDVPFNLMPLPFDVFLDLSETLDLAGSMLGNLKLAQAYFSQGDRSQSADLVGGIIKFIATEAPNLILLVRNHLAKSPGICDQGDDDERAEDRLAFDAWFMEQDAVGLLKALLPKAREVIGGRPLETQTQESKEAVPA